MPNPLLVTHCMVSNLPPNSLPHTDKKYNVADVITFACQPDFLLIGDAEATCQEDGEFTAISYTCTRGKKTFKMSGSDYLKHFVSREAKLSGGSH